MDTEISTMRITTRTKSSGNTAEEKSEGEMERGWWGVGGGWWGLIHFHLPILNFTWTIVFSFLLLFPFTCVCVCVCSQLDYNHITCIEDGAFRALRDLEVLWVLAYWLTLLPAAGEWWRVGAARADDARWPLEKTASPVRLLHTDCFSSQMDFMLINY